MSDRRRGSTLSRMSRGRQVVHDERGVLTAAVEPLDAMNSQTLVIQPNEWQREAWGYYKSLGEFNFAVGSWLSNAISRMRLMCAQVVPGGDEPTPVTEGPLAQIVSQLGGGLVGQSALLKRLAVHVSVPGDSYVAIEDRPEMPGVPPMRTYTAYSNSEIRLTSRTPTLRYQVNPERSVWRPLSDEALVSRVWWPDEEYQWRSTSPAEAALPIMREIDMWNRFMIAVLLSRVASNGLLIIPSEVTLPVNPRFKDQADPFMAEWIDIASRAVKNPGSPSAALPMPLKVPGAWIEHIKHLTFATDINEHIVENRSIGLNRLAATLNMPAESLKGMGEVNHWGAWQIGEDAVKIHLSPVIEVICQALTQTYLAPMAAAANIPLQLPDGSEYIIWYDPSALVQQPDRHEEAQELYDRGEISGEALRRDSGFEEADKPDATDLTYQVLLNIAMKGGPDSMAAAAKLLKDPSLAEIPQRITVTSPGADGAAPAQRPADEPVPSPGTVDKAEPVQPKAPAPTPGR